MIAIDTNLLVYAHRARTPEHKNTVAAIERVVKGGKGWGIALPSIGEFWSVVTHPNCPPKPSTPDQARSFLESLRRAVDRGLAVYAECGGAVYLGKGLEIGDRFYPFAGVFPVTYRLYGKPQGHGYTLLEVERENPIFAQGTCLRGHEFHYAGVRSWDSDRVRFACAVKRGFGFDGSREGLWTRNVYASFSHLHALGKSRWAEQFLGRAAQAV